ncbi:MAG TPA: VOC family protein, partial [Acidimicrobiia bacterium]|nr:VOC family protein [Acidimicrobiia bacterium]
FGWNVEMGPPEAGGYSIATLRGKPVAGIGPQMNPGPPYWTTYVSVDSADEAVARAKANGATVYMEPMDVMDAGRMAVFADPIGAVISVWQPNSHPGAGIVNEPNSYSWSELVTTDVEKSKQFYGAVFGWGSVTHGEGSPGAYTEWKIGDRSVGGMMEKPPMMPADVPPHWGVYFSVDGTDAAMEKVKALGGQVLMGPMDVEPGRFAVVSDPQGAVFNIITMTAQH